MHQTRPAHDSWYKTVRWQRLRWSILKRDGFTCQMCGRVNGKTSELVADHRTPHRGDEALFWDENNLWTLCKSPCHDKHKQRQERGGARIQKIGLDGWPIEEEVPAQPAEPSSGKAKSGPSRRRQAGGEGLNSKAFRL
jgi:5-methylcytosine-specific restriction endonuclease McrA